MKIIIPLIDTYRQIYTNCREDMNVTFSRFVASLGVTAEVLVIFMFTESLCVLIAPNLREVLFLKIRNFLNIYIVIVTVFTFIFIVGSEQLLLNFEKGENYAKYSKKTGFYKLLIFYFWALLIGILVFFVITYRV